MSDNKTSDSYNQYPPTKANDYGTELIQHVIEFMRCHRNCFTSAEASNIGTEVTAILNGNHKI